MGTTTHRDTETVETDPRWEFVRRRDPAADGRFVYAANRGDNALLVYRVDAASGMLSPVQRLPSGGQAPWSFTLHASGRWMLVAHQKSGTVDVVGIDPASGRLAATGRAVAVPAPVCVTIVP